MDNFMIGDLVQHQSKNAPSLYQKLWENKVGLVTKIRNKQRLAYIKWSDNTASDVWIAYDDLKLLSRE